MREEGNETCTVRRVRDPVIMPRAKAVQLRAPNLFFYFSAPIMRRKIENDKN